MSRDLSALEGIAVNENERTVLLSGMDSTVLLFALSFLKGNYRWLAGVTDTLTPDELDRIDEIQASALNAVITEVEIVSAYVGEVRMFTSVTVPEKWLECTGQSISRVDYADLFAVIGTTYGDGDGSTTFTLPQTRGRFPVGHLPFPGSDMNIGVLGGENYVTLTEAQMPPHTHEGRVQANAGSGGAGYIQGTRTKQNAYQTGSTGGGEAHENRPQYIPFVLIIYAGV